MCLMVFDKAIRADLRALGNLLDDRPAGTADVARLIPEALQLIAVIRPLDARGGAAVGRLHHHGEAQIDIADLAACLQIDMLGGGDAVLLHHRLHMTLICDVLRDLIGIGLCQSHLFGYIAGGDVRLIDTGADHQRGVDRLGNLKHLLGIHGALLHMQVGVILRGGMVEIVNQYHIIASAFELMNQLDMRIGSAQNDRRRLTAVIR